MDAVSGFHRTAPVGGPAGQQEYLNAAAEIRTDLSPQQLLEALQAIEAELGRDRSKEQRWGPRRCDMDILLIEDLVLQTERLTVPHPRLAERLFMLKPLAEIASQAVCPPGRKTVGELLADLEGCP